MSNYVNVGVYPPYNRTKKALKEAISRDPKAVILYTTSLFGVQFSGRRVSALDPGDYTVVGPEPQTSRKWYATITVMLSAEGDKIFRVA